MQLPAIGITFFQMAAQFVTYALIPAVLIQLSGVSREYIAVALLIYGTGGIVGNIAVTAVVDRLGHNRLIAINLTCLSAVFLVLSLFDFSPALGVGFLFVWSFFALALFAPQQMRLVALAPEQ